jgi:hypothetical protein
MSTKKKTGAKAPRSKTAGAVPAAALPAVAVRRDGVRAYFFEGDAVDPYSALLDGPPGSDAGDAVDAEILRLRAEGRAVTVS